MNQKCIKRQSFTSLIIAGCAIVLALTAYACQGNELQKKMLVGTWKAADALSDNMILNEDGSGKKGNPAFTGYHDITWDLVEDSLIINSDVAHRRARYKIEDYRDTIVSGKHIYGLFLSSINEYGDKIEDVYRRIE